MAQEPQIPEIKLDSTQLYREEMYTDRKAGTLRRLVPVKSDGSDDSSRPVLYSGQTQLLTPAGVLPLAFELEASSLEDACNKFPEAVKVAIEQAIEEAREMRREAASRIVVPEAGGGMGGPPGTVISVRGRRSGSGWRGRGGRRGSGGSGRVCRRGRS